MTYMLTIKMERKRRYPDILKSRKAFAGLSEGNWDWIDE